MSKRLQKIVSRALLPIFCHDWALWQISTNCWSIFNDKDASHQCIRSFSSLRNPPNVELDAQTIFLSATCLFSYGNSMMQFF